MHVPVQDLDAGGDVQNQTVDLVSLARPKVEVVG